MLKKNNRADTETVERIFKEGKFINSPHLTFKFILNSENGKRISFITPKSVAKLAVKRNLLRRRGYSVLRRHIDQFPTGLEGVFIFKKYQDNTSVLEHEIKSILSKIN